MSSSSRKVSLVKNARGDMRFEGCEPGGGKVTIKNHGKSAINLNGWILKKVISGADKYTYTFGDVNVAPGKELTLCAKGAEDMAGFGDIICENFTWGSTGKFYLHDDKGAEKCSMDIRMT